MLHAYFRALLFWITFSELCASCSCCCCCIIRCSCSCRCCLTGEQWASTLSGIRRRRLQWDGVQSRTWPAADRALWLQRSCGSCHSCRSIGWPQRQLRRTGPGELLVAWRPGCQQRLRRADRITCWTPTGRQDAAPLHLQDRKQGLRYVIQSIRVCCGDNQLSFSLCSYTFCFCCFFLLPFSRKQRLSL